jgi:methylmalonyl-CoA mutase C-terminal domain/subunit
LGKRRSETDVDTEEGGGIIPREDMEELYKQGCGRLFGPGTPTTDILTYLKEKFPDRV